MPLMGPTQLPTQYSYGSGQPSPKLCPTLAHSVLARDTCHFNIGDITLLCLTTVHTLMRYCIFVIEKLMKQWICMLDPQPSDIDQFLNPVDMQIYSAVKFR